MFWTEKKHSRNVVAKTYRDTEEPIDNEGSEVAVSRFVHLVLKLTTRQVSEVNRANVQVI